MDSESWQNLACAIVEEIEAGAEGVIVTHGTDTMMYTAAALSFMIETPVPIVLVGSQRSADRPSSDNAMNAICAALVAISEIAEVSVVMHGTTADDFCEIHRGTKVRKMHTSRRDAFKSLNSLPIGVVDYNTGEIETFMNYTRRGEKTLKFKPGMESKCALVKFTPGADPAVLDYYIERVQRAGHRRYRSGACFYEMDSSCPKSYRCRNSSYNYIPSALTAEFVTASMIPVVI